MVATRLVCAGCGAEASLDDPAPFRCPGAGRDDTDHVMTKTLSGGAWAALDGDPYYPFIRYRSWLHSWNVARAHGMKDEAYIELVRELDEAVALVDGHGFHRTPTGWVPALGEELGLAGVWFKDETCNVSGSHKARHLMGIMLFLEVAERVGLARDEGAPLAIASCGNAALAAAVVAKAADRTLEVFIPPSANPRVVERLQALGAVLAVCPRVDDAPGDPCYHAFRKAVASGRVPFSCQGPDNGLTIEGGATLGYELAWDLERRNEGLDRLFIQVGGGALASAVLQGLTEAKAGGAPIEVPRVHTVQTRGAYPLRRAYDRVAARALAGLGACGEQDAARAECLRANFNEQPVQDALRYATTHRSEFMWPWEEAPHSMAHGILDDETYDWLAVVRGMLATGGWPVVVDEEAVGTANVIAYRTTRIPVDPTGSAGLAGLVALRRQGVVGSAERVAVIFSGARR